MLPSYPRRIGALLIDWFIASFSGALLTGTSVYGSHTPSWWVPLAAFWVEVTLLTGLLGYSIGKRILGLRVINTEGNPPGLARAAVRTALICLFVPALIMTADRRGMQDIAAGTKVVPA